MKAKHYSLLIYLLLFKILSNGLYHLLPISLCRFENTHFWILEIIGQSLISY